MNFIILYDKIDKCQRCNKPLETYCSKSLNLSKYNFDDLNNAVFVLYKCDNCKINYSYSLTVFKCIL